MLREEAVLIINGTPRFFPALAVAISASSVKIPWTPIGAIKMGDEYFFPKRVV